MKSPLDPSEIVLRSYEDTEDDKILEFLNLSYGHWGERQRWDYVYKNQPLFTPQDVAIMEHEGKIIGFGGMLSRFISYRNKKLTVVLFGDGAIHPEFRGMRLHSKLLIERFQRAWERNACLCIGWAMKNSDAYKSDMRVGFVDVKQHHTYLKIIDPARVLKAGLFDLFSKNKRLRNALEALNYPIIFKTGGQSFALSNFTDKAAEMPKKGIAITLKKEGIKFMYSFRSIGQFHRASLLVYLFLTRKVKVSFPSLKAFWLLVKNIKTIGSSL
jgi:hypothetical protein